MNLAEGCGGPQVLLVWDGNFPVAGFDLSIEAQFAIRIFGASGLAIGCLELIVNVIGRRVILLGLLEMFNGFERFTIFEEHLSELVLSLSVSRMSVGKLFQNVDRLLFT